MATLLDFQLRTRLVFGPAAIGQLGPLARELGFTRPLLVADHGLVAAGHVGLAERELHKAGIDPIAFHDFGVNPDTAMIERGRAFAAPLGIDSIIGLGGGSSLDCAKGINFVLTNGGRMHDYRGYGKASTPLLPMMSIPTTAGTGSEAQSYAVISDAATHMKMACGDPTAACRVAILDPELTCTQPTLVTAASGYDAIAHAVETCVATKRTIISDCFSREAWRLLSSSYARVLAHPDDIETRGAMQLGAFYAGLAIEQSMLGAAHACANPLTARYDMTHGVALAILLPHVVRWNGRDAPQLYTDFAISLNYRSLNGSPAAWLAQWLSDTARAAGLPSRLQTEGVEQGNLASLAEEAARQWTGTFNPRPLTAADALEVYTCAY